MAIFPFQWASINPFRRIPAQLLPYCVKPPQRAASTLRWFSLYGETCTRNVREKVFGSPLNLVVSLFGTDGFTFWNQWFQELKPRRFFSEKSSVFTKNWLQKLEPVVSQIETNGFRM
jgi:hypothetical protein